MSIKLMSEIWESGPQNISERMVLLALADYANDAGTCWPSISGIQKKSCLSERGVQTVIRRLQDAGWIEIEAGGGRKNANLYRIKTPQRLHPAGNAPPQMDAETPQMTAVNPAGAAPEPLRTIKEPSEIKRAAQFPENWMPNEKTIEWCISKQYDETQIGQMVEDCVNHHRGKGNTFKCFESAFRTWASHQIKFHGTPEQQRNKHVKSRSNQKQAGMAEDPALKQIARLAGLR